MTPLIDRVHCERDFDLTVIFDPYLTLGLFKEEAEPPWPGLNVVLVDRYPREVGLELRYQLVYFDVRGEITHLRTSDWVATEVLP